MMSATYFGEITELESRAVWYSDEEDEDDDDMDEDSRVKISPQMNLITPQSHETLRSSVATNFATFLGLDASIKLTGCIISQSSSKQFKNFRIKKDTCDILLGLFGDIGRAIACPIKPSLPGVQTKEYTLWLSFNSTGQHISGPEVGYLAELIREQLYNQLAFDPSSQVFILSEQFSNSEQLEFLSNTQILSTKLPFQGQPMRPPSLIRNHFESALFEQLTLSLKPAILICLPDPKNCWFDKTKSWPTVPDMIIEQKLTDDSLEKTLIFT